MEEGSPPERFCPVCGQTTDAPTCPRDGIETLERRALSLPITAFRPGALVAGGRYRIDSVLGAGAMGTVYAATQLAVQRTVALKVLHQNMSTDEAGVRRFYREARSASRLKHPNVVNIYDFGIDAEANTPFIAMEFLEGRSLREVIQADGPFEPIRAAHLLEQVARALAAAHDAEIVHRDLKPDNIMVTRLADGLEHVVVLDFGIAKPLRSEEGTLDNLTGSGMIMGSPRYMSPEQVRGKALDGRSDLYALGCILHEMLTGKSPFDGKQFVEVMMSHLRAERPTLEGQEVRYPVPPALVELHRRLLSVDFNERPPNARVVAQLLREVSLAPPSASSSFALEPGRAGSSVNDDAEAAVGSGGFASGSVTAGEQAPLPAQGQAESGRIAVLPIPSGEGEALSSSRPVEGSSLALEQVSAGPREAAFGETLSLRASDLEDSPLGGRSPEAPRHRARWLVLAALTSAGLGTAGILAYGPTGVVPPSPPTATTEAQIILGEPSVGPEEASEAKATQEPEEVSAAALTPPPAPREVTILSRPPGARVSVDGREIGPTPQRVEVSSEVVLVSLEKRGYETVSIRLDPRGTETQRTVRLRPRLIQSF